MIRIDPDGRRSVQAEVEVPGTPDEVWQAIATGPGISSWFVPAQVDGQVGGETRTNFGPGMESKATITAWEPPHRFVAENAEDLGPESPTVATEWIVEARSGGACVVRVVHSWFTDSDEWDDQFIGHTYGWAAFFRVLRLYLTHFGGQPSVVVPLMAVASGTKAEAWAALTTPFGLDRVSVGDRFEPANGAPAIAGVVEAVGIPEWPELLLRLERPGPGIAHLVPHDMGGQVMLSVRFYLYGPQAQATADAISGEWQSWLNTRFPPAEG